MEFLCKADDDMKKALLIKNTEFFKPLASVEGSSRAKREWQPNPEGPNDPIFQDSSSKSRTLDGFWAERP